MSMEKDFQWIQDSNNEDTLREKFSNHLVIILKEMCRRVGVDYDKVYFHKDGWWRTKEWTEEEYNKFKKWLVDYLYKSNDARKEIMEYNYKTKKQIKKVVDMFGLQYGWKFTREVRNE